VSFVILLTAILSQRESNANDFYQDWKDAQQCIPNCTPTPLKATNYISLYYAPVFEGFINIPLSFPLTYVTNLAGCPTFSLINPPSFASLNGNIFTVDFGNPTTNSPFNIRYEVTIGCHSSQGLMQFNRAADATDATGDMEILNFGLISAYNADAASQNAILVNARFAAIEEKLLNLCSLKEEIMCMKKMLKKSLKQS
jgi:hypothetical protein